MRTMIFKRREKLEDAEQERRDYLTNSKQLVDFLTQRYVSLEDIFVPSFVVSTDHSRIKREGFTHLIELSILNTMPTLMYVQAKFTSKLPVDYNVFLLEVPAECVNKCSTTVFAPAGGIVTAHVSWGQFSFTRKITLSSVSERELFADQM